MKCPSFQIRNLVYRKQSKTFYLRRLFKSITWYIDSFRKNIVLISERGFKRLFNINILITLAVYTIHYFIQYLYLVSHVLTMSYHGLLDNSFLQPD